MNIILLERIARLGQMGDVVRVRDGYARNFLLPQGKALRADDDNRARFESQRAQLEARNLDRRQEAEAVATRVAGQSFTVIRQAGETGQLYGSVSPRDLVEIMVAGGFSVARNQIDLHNPIKTIGVHEIRIVLHPEVDTTVTVNVARSDDEAVRQGAGEDMTMAGGADEAEPEAAAASGDEGESLPDEAPADAPDGPDQDKTAGND